MSFSELDRFFTIQRWDPLVICDDLDDELDCEIHPDDHLWDHTPTIDRCNYRDCNKKLTGGNRKIEVRPTGLNLEGQEWGYCLECYEKLEADRAKELRFGSLWRNVLDVGAGEPRLRSTR